MNRLVLLCAVLSFACGQAPGHPETARIGLKGSPGDIVAASATARVVEAGIQSIEDIGGGDYRWTWRVHIVGAGGSCGPDEQADVGVITGSATALPGTVTRCTAYAEYVDEDLACASNTVGTLGCDIQTYALGTPL